MTTHFDDPAGRTPSALRGAPRYSVGMSYPRARPGGAAHAQRPDDDAQAAPDIDQSAYVAARPAGWRPLVHGMGALVSLALLGGLGVWGYGQVMRDVAGVPVVEATGGAMRIAPERPGGQITQASGLAVNEVKAGAPADDLPARVVLAPPPIELSAEDRPGAALLVEAGQGTAPPPRKVIEPAPGLATADALAAAPTTSPPAMLEARHLPSDAIATSEELALAEAVAASLVSGLADGPSGGLTGGLSGGTTAPSAAPDAASAGPSLATSPRPLRRPAPRSEAPTASATPTAGGAAGLSGGEPAPIVTDLAARGPSAVDETATPAPGTRLVQLGAFPSPDEARAAWAALAAEHAPLMERKGRVVQEAEAGGRAFWRLRAQGFDDLAQARRFCAALVAEGADCIPVLAR